MPEKEISRAFLRIKQPVDQVYRSRKEMLLNNFLGGMVWSLGTLVGAAIIITLAGLFLSKINLPEVIGSWVSEIIQQATPKNSILMPK